MNKYFLLSFLFLVGFSACKKSDSTTSQVAAQSATDDANLQIYMKANNITAIHDPNGFYYQVLTPGTGAYPKSTSNVTVSDTGKTLDGTVFQTDVSKYYSLALVIPTAGGVIPGWPLGIPHINPGGTILLLFPSALGFGSSTTSPVAANSCVVYKLTLQGFN